MNKKNKGTCEISKTRKSCVITIIRPKMELEKYAFFLGHLLLIFFPVKAEIFYFSTVIIGAPNWGPKNVYFAMKFRAQK